MLPFQNPLSRTMMPLLASALLWSAATAMIAQDQQFTQFNAAPTSINPAYAGVSGKARLASLYRTQWTALPQAFTGFHFAYDRLPLTNESVMGLASHEQAGAGARVAFNSWDRRHTTFDSIAS